MKVISIVLNNFLNDSRVLKEAITLKEKGDYDITVVALHEEGLLEKEKIDGIKVQRINLKTKSWSKNQAIQFIKYLEFSFRVIKNFKKVDIIHCNDLGPLPIAYIIKKLSGNHVKIVYDAHEYETETNGLRGIKKKFVSIIEKLLVKKVDAVITVSDSIAEEYVRLYNIDKPKLVLNCPSYQSVQSTDKFRKKFGLEQKMKIFLYQGALNQGRGLDVILDAFTDTDERAVLIVMGYGPMKEKVIKYAKMHNNIFYHNAVTPNELLSYTSSADVGICMIEDVCLSYKYSLPNKFFEYAMAGLPIITNNLIEVKKITEEFQCGWILREESPSELRKLIKRVLNEDLEIYKLNAKKMSEIYSWGNQEDTLLGVYKGLNQ